MKRKHQDLDNKNQIDEINLIMDELTKEYQRLDSFTNRNEIILFKDNLLRNFSELQKGKS